MRDLNFFQAQSRKAETTAYTGLEGFPTSSPIARKDVYTYGIGTFFQAQSRKAETAVYTGSEFFPSPNLRARKDVYTGFKLFS